MVTILFWVLMASSAITLYHLILKGGEKPPDKPPPRFAAICDFLEEARSLSERESSPELANFFKFARGEWSLRKRERKDPGVRVL